MADKQYVLKGSLHIPFLATRSHYRYWRSVWLHNTALKAKRKNPLLLFHGDKNNPGDTVLVREIKKKTTSGATRQHHPHQIATDKVFLRLRVLDENLDPPKDATYTLRVGLKRYPESGEGEFEEGGMINVEVPKLSQSAKLVVRYKQQRADKPKDVPSGDESDANATETEDTAEAEAEPDVIEVTYDLRVGALNPIQEEAPDDKCLSGVQQRLNNLGFDAGIVDGVDGPNTQNAIRRFQTLFKLTVNGEADAATQKALHDFHDQPGKVPGKPPPRPKSAHPAKPKVLGAGEGGDKPKPPPKPKSAHPAKPKESGTGGGGDKPKPPPRPKSSHPAKPKVPGTGGGGGKPKPPPRPKSSHPPKPSI